MAQPMGESKDGVLGLDFDRRQMLQFRGSGVTSEAGLLARTPASCSSGAKIKSTKDTAM
jgi:hypothetical protein